MTTKRKVFQRPRLYYGWVVVGVVALVGFAQSADTLPVLSVFLKPITEDFGWSRSVFTGAITIGTFLGGLLALGVGPFLDRFGGRWTLVVAFVILGGTLVLLAEIDRLWQFYALLILARGVAMGIIGLSLQVIIPKWFVSKRGKAAALGGMGNIAGNTATPLYVQLLISLAGWRLATATTGIVVWVLSILPVALFLRRRPEDLGLLPDGAAPPPTHQQQTSAGLSHLRESGLETSLSLRQVLHQPSFYFLTTAVGLMTFVIPALNLHTVAYFTDQGISSGIAVSALALISLAGAPGALLSGYLADRYSARKILTIDVLLVATSFALLLVARSPAVALLWGLYLGLVRGGMHILQQVIFADYFGRDNLGAVRGVVWPIQMVGNSLGPLAAAATYDITGNYVFIFSSFGVICLLAGLCIPLASPPTATGAPSLDSPTGQA